MTPVVAGRVDRDGALVAADQLLYNAQKRAGASLGEAIAIPHLARLVGSALMEKKSVRATLVLGDDDSTVRALADITPDDGGAVIEITDWRIDLAEPALFRANQAPVTSLAAWRWECDAALRLISLRAGPEAFPLPAQWKGALMMDIFDLHRRECGIFPLLDGRRNERDFERQRVSISSNDRHDLLLSGRVVRDGRGGFSGFIGTADPFYLADIGLCPHFALNPRPPMELRFNQRVDEALRAPLNRIIAAADCINKQAEGRIRADYARYAGDIAEAGRHLMGLVDDLADVQNIERADFSVAQDNIDLGDLARRAAMLLAMKADEKKIRIHAPIEGKHFPAIGEFRRVLQILLNLIGNAIRYSPEKSEIWVRLDLQGDRAMVSVSDQGPGIPKEAQEKMFNKFERLGRRDSGGSGLGLYITRKLAQAMGGEIVVDSQIGLGTTMTLQIAAR